MEKEIIDAIEVELDMAIENFESAGDDINALRFRRATSGLYFALEHLAKALLLTAGIEVESHGGVTRMLGLHFVKPKNLSPRVTRHLGSLCERRYTAEYSPRAAWEFTSEEIETYLQWVKLSAVEITAELEKQAPEMLNKVKETNTKLKLSK
jgi:uncharacterized protein (UPF0332 family)